MKKKVVSVLLALLLVGCGISGNDSGNGRTFFLSFSDNIQLLSPTNWSFIDLVLT